MPLNPPTVGRLSVCSTNVILEHQLPGAELTLHVRDEEHSLGQAKSAWEVVDLPAGLRLFRDDRVVVTQSLSGQTSPGSIPAVVEGLGSTPSRPQPHPDSHIYNCAGNVALDGMSPGAEAEILAGGTVIGRAVAPEGACIVELSSAVPGSPGLTARALTCGQPPMEVTLPAGDPPPLDQQDRLPAPKIGGPLMECMSWLQLEGIVPGATVILEREDGSSQSWAVATRTWPVPLRRPLDLDEEIVLRQEFPLCRISGRDYRNRVAPLAARTPRLDSPWCTGRIRASNLTPGGTLIFYTDQGEEIGRSGVAGTSGDFTVYQPNTATVHARQELCAVMSQPSNAVDAGQWPATTRPDPRIHEPVRACQTLITVRGQVAPGGLTEVWSYERGLIGWRHAMARETIVPVSGLLPGEEIEARLVTCAGQEGTSPVVVAQDIGDIPEPVIETPVHGGSNRLWLSSLKEGARLAVYVNGELAASRTIEESREEVGLDRYLQVGQQVNARQGLCDQWRTSDHLTVVAPPEPPQPEEPKEGFSKVIVLNCHTWQRSISVWKVKDGGAPERVGSLEHNYNEWGTCPAAGSPLEIDLDDGARYSFIFLDEEQDNCGGDDPLDYDCWRDSIPLILGSSSGGPFYKTAY